MTNQSNGTKLADETIADEENENNERWKPEINFEGIYIYIDEDNNCVIEGPEDRVTELKERIFNKILNGYEKVASLKIKTINKFLLQCSEKDENEKPMNA